MATLDSTSIQAVSRLFDLSRSGETGSGEFDQLDSMIYAQLLGNYDALPTPGAQPDCAAG